MLHQFKGGKTEPIHLPAWSSTRPGNLYGTTTTGGTYGYGMVFKLTPNRTANGRSEYSTPSRHARWLILREA